MYEEVQNTIKEKDNHLKMADMAYQEKKLYYYKYL